MHVASSSMADLRNGRRARPIRATHEWPSVPRGQHYVQRTSSHVASSKLRYENLGERGSFTTKAEGLRTLRSVCACRQKVEKSHFSCTKGVIFDGKLHAHPPNCMPRRHSMRTRLDRRTNIAGLFAHVSLFRLPSHPQRKYSVSCRRQPSLAVVELSIDLRAGTWTCSLGD